MTAPVEVGQMRRLPSGVVCEVVEINPGQPSPTALIWTVERGATVNVPWLEANAGLVEDGEG